MKLGKRMYRHGDLLIREIDNIPETAKELDGNILAFGEVTGHKHELNGKVKMFDNGGQKLFQIEQDTKLTHQEHKTITIKKGKYAVINEREYQPFAEEIRKVMD